MKIENLKAGISEGESPTAFRPVLGLAALTFFGIAFVGPTAPYTFFGIGSDKSAGHLALVYVIALVAMMFTAASYGLMANAHPKAGSVYGAESGCSGSLWQPAEHCASVIITNEK